MQDWLRFEGWTASMALNCGGGKQQQIGFNVFVVVEQIEKNGKKKVEICLVVLAGRRVQSPLPSRHMNALAPGHTRRA